jgi:hypothetical protein
MIRARGINKTRGLLTIYFLREMAVEKGNFVIELMNMPILRQGEREDDTNGGGFDNRVESLVKIDARLLSESTHNPVSSMTGKRSIGVIFVAEDPFVAYYVRPGRGRDKGPSVVLH